MAATLRPEPTYSIEDGVLHGRTPGVGGTELHDVFETGRAIPISMMGHEVQAIYEWKEEATLVASVHSAEFADGDVITIRRWVDSQSGFLVAESTCGGRRCTRTYRRRSET